ncbi:MAG: domain S-box protein [Gammaproteobacteria bacterium]|nr:domain S-box protein [Gammaproteobacteria bacterium]
MLQCSATESAADPRELATDKLKYGSRVHDDLAIISALMHKNTTTAGWFDAALSEHGGILALALQAGRVGLWSRNLLTDRADWSAQLHEIFGTTPETFDSSSAGLMSIIDPQDRASARQSIQQAIDTHSTLVVEFRIHQPNGELRWIATQAHVLYDELGKATQMYGIAVDITERKLAEIARAQLLESERSARSEAERLGHLKDEFLATLSHELRTPLSAIQGWATLLKQPNLSPADRRLGLDAIERNARSQAQIINDLLDMNRIVAGKFHLEVQTVHLDKVIHAAIEAVSPSAEAKRLRVRTLIDSGIGATRGDPNRLQQVMWNLLTNAVKFTPAGGFIQIILGRVNSHLEIVVEDNGAGISADFLPYVFDRFRQADASTTRRYGGLGLGLSIVKNLVELHGGSVRVKSAGENQGATFVVSLPVMMVDPAPSESSASSAPVPSEPPAIELPRLDNLRILVVDDEPDGRVLLARILHERGAIPTCTGDARVALDSLRNHTFDLLLSDIGMPGMDGYALIQQVRALTSPMGRIPAIAVTAYARAEDRQRSLLAGYQMHISKPLEATELIAAIASLLKVWRT